MVTAPKNQATQTWSSEAYGKNARFVTDLGAPVLELLDPKPGERILDVGCGDGILTKKIADRGCSAPTPGIFRRPKIAVGASPPPASTFAISS